MKILPSFPAAIAGAQDALKNYSYAIHTDRWQSMKIADKPEMEMYEVLNHSFAVAMPSESLALYRNAISPNLPWADNHFLERVGGLPLNPGVQWAKWPYATSADRFRSDEIFSHTYMERYWPKFAGKPKNESESTFGANAGYRFAYGDLNDVVSQLWNEPLTRQAFLPVWFPEDTGAMHGGRVPCSIGYHFIIRGGAFHVGYWLRSCDFVRHFRDDIYLTVRLGLWVLNECRKRALAFGTDEQKEFWAALKPGFYSMWMVSLHMFKNDYRVLYGVPHPSDRK